MDWDPDDQDKALAYQAAIAEVCPQCGTRDADWLGADKRFLDPPKVEVKAHTCPGCKELAAAREAVPDDADMRGVDFRVMRAERVARG